MKPTRKTEKLANAIDKLPGISHCTQIYAMGFIGLLPVEGSFVVSQDENGAVVFKSKYIRLTIKAENLKST